VAWCAALLAAAVPWIGCDEPIETRTSRLVRASSLKQQEIDACAIVTEAHASALFGKPALQRPAAPRECTWACDCDFPDASTWTMHVRVEHNRLVGPRGTPTAMIVRSEITVGARRTEDRVRKAVRFDDEHDVVLELISTGPSAPAADTKTAELEQLADSLARPAR
jgi:hypothetical protein